MHQIDGHIRDYQPDTVTVGNLLHISGFRASLLAIDVGDSPNFACAIGLIQMQAIFLGSRSVYACSSKAVHNIAESVLPFWSRQSVQITSAFGTSGSSVSLSARKTLLPSYYRPA